MRGLLLLAALALPAFSDATMVWSAGSGNPHGAQGGHSRQAAALTLVDGDGATAQLWLPSLEQRPLMVERGIAQLKPSGVDNYHLLLAKRDTAQLHEIALRYQYMNGKPSGHSPAELIYAEKVPLEIVPTPLTREHSRYISEQPAAFMIRFNDKPLTNQPIVLETSNGSRLESVSDSDGRVRFILPDDFHHVALGQNNNPPADYFVSTHYQNGGEEYRTTLSAAYYVNPRYWQSHSGAVWSGLAGFAGGLGILGLLARKKSRKGDPS